jgi:hypothetical protein
MIKPTTRDKPFRYVKVLFFSRFCSAPRLSRDSETADGLPSAVYPPAVDERGKRAGVKSKAEDTEYERPPRSALRAAGFALSRGSSFSRDSLREEDGPDREDVSDVGRSSCSESASEASSRESRPGCCRGFWISEKPGVGMVLDAEGQRDPGIIVASDGDDRTFGISHSRQTKSATSQDTDYVQDAVGSWLMSPVTVRSIFEVDE